MAYLCTVVTLIALAVKGFCGKKVSTCAKSGGHALLFNLIRILFCVPIAFLVLLFAGAGDRLAPDFGLVAISLLAGAANAAFLAFWMLAVQKNTMVAVDVTLTMGSLLPAILCAILFGEELSLPRMLGFAFILLAAFILAGGGKKNKQKKSLLGILLVVLAAVGDGMIGFSQQLFKQYYTEGGTRFTGKAYPAEIYHFYTYLFAGLFLLLGYLALLAFAKKKTTPAASSPVRWGVVLGNVAVMAACLFLANYTQTAASAVYGMPSQILYPVVKGGTLILVNVTALFFGERITRRTLLGTAVALGGILLMNLL